MCAALFKPRGKEYHVRRAAMNYGWTGLKSGMKSPVIMVKHPFLAWTNDFNGHLRLSLQVYTNYHSQTHGRCIKFDRDARPWISWWVGACVFASQPSYYLAWSDRSHYFLKWVARPTRFKRARHLSIWTDLSSFLKFQTSPCIRHPTNIFFGI